MDNQLDPEVEFIKATLNLIDHYASADDPSESAVKELEDILNSITRRIFQEKSESKSFNN